MLHESIKKYVRKIDNVEYSKTNEKLDLFTYDLPLDKNTNNNPYQINNIFLSKESNLIIRKLSTNSIQNGNFNFDKLFKEDPEIMFMRCKDSTTFVQFFNNGYEYFHNKDYVKAKYQLKKLLSLGRTTN